MKEINPKFYLNTKLKPDYQNRYPVYFRFNLNGTNHRLKSYFFDKLENEDLIKKNKYLLDLETKYINVLAKYSINGFETTTYSLDVEKLDKDLYKIYTSEDFDFIKIGVAIPIDDDEIDLYLDEVDDDNSGELEEKYIELYNQKPAYDFNNVYRKELIDNLVSKSDYDYFFIDSIVSKNIFEMKIKHPTDFIKDQAILDYVKSCNDLLDFGKFESINIYKWMFEGKGELFRKTYGDVSFNLINESVIFECSDIFYNENFKEMLKNKK